MTVKGPNKFLDNKNGTTSVLVSSGEGELLWSIFDSSYAVLISAYRWYVRTSRGKGYVCTNVGFGKSRRNLLMHDLVIRPGLGEEVDHINGDCLDNRIANLRLVSHRLNTLNRRSCSESGFKGVSASKSGLRWRAVIHKPSHKQIYLGTFDTPEEAARAYDEAAKELFGEYAWLNNV